MSSLTKILITGICATLLCGCVGVRTGNGAVDTAVNGTLAVVDAKSEAKKQDQKSFENDLTKLNVKPK
jgi:hypothetical protein